MTSFKIPKNVGMFREISPNIRTLYGLRLDPSLFVCHRMLLGKETPCVASEDLKWSEDANQRIAQV
jgi:hypothetical protein